MDRAVLASLQNALDPQLLEDAVKLAVTEIEKEQPTLSKQRETLERELLEVDSRLHHLAEAIAATGGSETIYSKIKDEEQRRNGLQNQLSRLIEMAKVTSLDSARLILVLRTRVGDLQELLSRQVFEARKILRATLNGSLIFQPIEVEGRAGYRFFGTGSYGSLLAYSQASNDGGGGQGI
ncbi:MAG TPA: hypothetical protein VJV04_00145 [Nitrospiraceae bacterium]|nr:hypothetical protein [Nitrospiraceae bacterium]